MKPNEILLNSPLDELLQKEIDLDHVGSAADTPLRADAFDLTDKEKDRYHFQAF